ncbi:hypothetical protein C943_03734 [Mariniradius saccharolyticus AK6]|uniref:Uncharacterized protein n=1 Tax=Mariniradius saccharolyticus AK6 TaxID=1239962 RepID=M7XAR3_9BACT|nr:hypothetical protein C943_03734 [Mariniradius saccharolyticus AK6]
MGQSFLKFQDLKSKMTKPRNNVSNLDACHHLTGSTLSRK